jgi:hypothetical protein
MLLRSLHTHLPTGQILLLLLHQRIDLHPHADEFEAGDVLVTFTTEKFAEPRPWMAPP